MTCSPRPGSSQRVRGRTMESMKNDWKDSMRYVINSESFVGFTDRVRCGIRGSASPRRAPVLSVSRFRDSWFVVREGGGLPAASIYGESAQTGLKTSYKSKLQAPRSAALERHLKERRSQGRASGCESHVQPEGCRSKRGGRKSHSAKDGLPIFQLKIGGQ